MGLFKKKTVIKTYDKENKKPVIKAMYNAVKAANPDWEIGQSFDSSILSSVTCESVEANLVQSGNTFITKSIEYSI